MMTRREMMRRFKDFSSIDEAIREKQKKLESDWSDCINDDIDTLYLEWQTLNHFRRSNIDDWREMAISLRHLADKMSQESWEADDSWIDDQTSSLNDD